KLAPLLVSLSLFLVPAFSIAQTGGVSGGLSQSGLSSVFGNSSEIGRAQTPRQLIVAIIRIMLFFAGLVAVVFVIIGGYFYVTAQGNEEQAEKGKNTLVNALIGIILIVLSYVIVTVVSNLVSNQTGIL